MAWVPISDSGLGFSFASASGFSTLEGSVVQFSCGGDSAWDILFDSEVSVTLRVSALSYQTSGGWQGDGYQPAAILWDPGGQENHASPYPAVTFPNNDPVTSFSPNPVEQAGNFTYINYYSARAFVDGDPEGVPIDSEFQFLVEVWEDDPVPPGEEAPPYVIRGTHRAYMGVDSPQTAWIRDEAGAHDLTAYDAITVEIKGPSRDRPNLTVDATGTAGGKLQFTIPADGARKRLYPGTFNLFAKADGLVIYTGLLEVLA